MENTKHSKHNLLCVKYTEFKNILFYLINFSVIPSRVTATMSKVIPQWVAENVLDY